MNQRVLTSLGITAVVIALAAVLLAQVPAAAQTPKTAATTAAATPAPAAKPLAPPKPAVQAKSGWTVPRTPDGVPDLQGYWTNNSYTPLERPNGVT
jgi:hypothetical protein